MSINYKQIFEDAHSKGFAQVEALLEKAYRACFNV